MQVLKSRVNNSTHVRQERRTIVFGCPLQTQQHSYASYDDRCNVDVKTTPKYIMFSVITNIYNKKTKGPTLMEFFTA
jgi:hypothetical protein